MADENVDYRLALDQMDDRQRDREAANERHRMSQEALVEVEKAKARTQRWQALQTLFGGLCAALAVVGLAVVIWLGVRGPSADDLLHQEARKDCLAAGGTWLGVNGTEDVNSCVMPGASTK